MMYCMKKYLLSKYIYSGLKISAKNLHETTPSNFRDAQNYYKKNNISPNLFTLLFKLKDNYL